jgi:hypothetical protein
MDEKRKAERLIEENEVTITVISDRINIPKEKITNSYSKDISVSGTKIHTNIFLPVDIYLMIEFSLDDLPQKINSIGKVKWIKVISDDESYDAGVEFDSPSKKLAEYIGGRQRSKKS